MSKASIETDFRDYGLSYPICKQKQTNADHIRSMSDDELAEYLYSIQNAECELRFCKNKAECDSKLDKGQTITDSECKKCLVEWLQTEVEE